MPPAPGTSFVPLRAPWLSPWLRADSRANPIPGWRPPLARRGKRATGKAGLESPLVVDGITVPPGIIHGRLAPGGTPAPGGRQLAMKEIHGKGKAAGRLITPS